MRLTDLLNLSNVPRWTIVPRLREQSVADHTFRVAVIAWEIADRLGVELDGGDFRYILTHDGLESWTGDMPGVTKRIPSLKEGEGIVGLHCPWMIEDSRRDILIKAADLVETITFAQAWIPNPRREYVVRYLTGRLEDYCGRQDRTGKLMGVARAVISLIEQEYGRCSDPSWIR